MADSAANLRRLAIQRRAAATAKINRLANNGIHISGTGHDPRASADDIRGMNARQVRSYLKKLSEFTSRQNSYIKIGGGAVISKSVWKAYKDVEAEYNRIGREHERKISSTFIPTAGMTIKQRDSMMRPTSIVSAAGATVNRPYIRVERHPENVNGVESLQKLQHDLKRKLTRQFYQKEIRAGREQLSQMLTVIGLPEFHESSKKLTAHQFDTLWNYTDFATNISTIYHALKMGAAKQAYRIVEDNSSDVRELFEWAASLPKDASPASAKAATKARRARKS